MSLLDAVLRRLGETVGVHVLVADPELTALQYVSPGAECLLGPLEGMPDAARLRACVHADDREALDAALATYRAARAAFRRRFRWQVPAGEVRSLQLDVAPLADAGGVVLGHLGVVRDLTLLQAGALSDVGAELAHEINNPLAGIKNAMLLLKDAIPADHAYAPFVGLIDREVTRIADIVKRLYERV